jgi:MFS family permease
MTTASPSINRNRLFVASCVALITTAMTFAIRANILNKLGEDFKLDNFEVGLCAGTAFWGFTLAMIFGGFLVDRLGMKLLIWLAFSGHLIGIGLTMVATGFWSLFISTLFVGIANGMVEAACNPMVASMFPDNKTTMLNRFHLWFPGGIVIGGLTGYLIEKELTLSWEWQMAAILLPTLIYGALFLGQTFIKTERVTSGVSEGSMLKACLSPLFLVMVFCMLLTSATELGTGQWINVLLEQQVSNPILVLVFISGIMALGRGFAGTMVHSLAPTGMLLFSAIFSAIGLVLLGSGYVWPGAAVFAVGVCYFWPTMIGFVSEYIPQSGALGMSIMGGAGMLSVSIVLPFMGSLYAANKEKVLSTLEKGADVNMADLADQAGLIAGQTTLTEVALLPVVLGVIFAILYFSRKSIGAGASH